MRIRAVDARFGGASHDSFVWNLSEIRQHLLEQRNTGTRNTWLLGSQDFLKWFFLKILHCIYKQVILGTPLSLGS